MKIDNILPIGTVVKLKGINTKIIICGYCSESENESNYVWDYSGFGFPLGYTKPDMIVSFDSDQIETIITYGFQDEEQLSYIEEFKEVIKDIEKGKKEN